MIELSELIGELRRELQQARSDGAGKDLQFELGPVQLDLEVVVEREGGAAAKVRFWVVELGTDGKAARTSSQRLSLTLLPRLAGSEPTPETRRGGDGAPWVRGPATYNER